MLTILSMATVDGSRDAKGKVVNSTLMEDSRNGNSITSHFHYVPSVMTSLLALFSAFVLLVFSSAQALNFFCSLSLCIMPRERGRSQEALPTIVF
jgi:hypothetical protein